MLKYQLLLDKKIQKLMTDIGGGWYIEKSARGLPPLKRTKLSKKVQERQDYIQWWYSLALFAIYHPPPIYVNIF